MLHRRPTATALVAVLLPLAAALTSCADEPRSNQINTIGAGTNDRDASVDVLGARVLAYADGQGRLIGTFVYNENDAEEPATLDEVAGEGVTVAGGGPTGIEVAPNEFVNLAAEDATPVPVEGDFAAGDFIELRYSFSTGETVTLEVPVVKACGQYADITQPEGAATDAEETEATTETDAEAHAEETDAEAHAEESDATYLCDHPTEHAEEEGGH